MFFYPHSKEFGDLQRTVHPDFKTIDEFCLILKFIKMESQKSGWQLPLRPKVRDLKWTGGGLFLGSWKRLLWFGLYGYAHFVKLYQMLHLLVYFSRYRL